MPLIDEAFLKADATPSPFYRLLGMAAESATEDSARVVMKVTEDLLQFQGAVHGGAVYSVADAAVAIASLVGVEEGTHAPTIEGKLNFLAPARGDEVFVTPRSCSVGGGLSSVRSTSGTPSHWWPPASSPICSRP